MKKKSRKVKAITKSKTFISKKKLRGNITLDNSSDEGSDVDSESFYHDVIDDFHKKEDEKLSTDDELIGYNDDSSEEEEVLPITDDDKDMESDVDEKEDALPHKDAWGKKKSWYYNADFVDEDRGRSYREADAEAAKAEEEEALAIQKSLVSGISAENFSSIFSKFEDSAELSENANVELEEKTPDWDAISRPEKLKLLRKISPELILVIDEFKEKLAEVKDRLAPILEFMKNHKIASEECEKYLKLKYQILLHYCMNISFYMVIRCDGPVSNHPVQQRIDEYGKLLEELKPIDEKLNPEIDVVLEKLRKGEEIVFKMAVDTDKQINEDKSHSADPQEVPNEDSKTAANKKKSNTKLYDTEVEKEIFALYSDMKKRQKDKDDESLDDMEEEEQNPEDGDVTEEKRMITYQISKNKGLIPRRKKEYRNPRVRHRMKFKKAKIRRKGQIREVTREVKKYDGESTGISTHVIKSIKFK